MGAAKDVGGLHVVASRVDCCDAGALRKLGDALRDKDANAVAVIAAVNGGKISFQCVAAGKLLPRASGPGI